MLLADQFQDGARIVRVGHHDGRAQFLAAVEEHSVHPAVLHQDPFHPLPHPDGAAVPGDRLDQRRGEHLSAADRVGGAAQIVVHDAGVHADGGFLGPDAVVEGLGGERGARVGGQFAVLEQGVQRAAPPGRHRGGAPQHLGRLGAGRGQQGPAHLRADRRAHLDELPQTFLVLREYAGEAVEIAVPARGHEHPQTREDDLVEAVGVHGAEGDAVLQGQAAQDRRQHAVGPAVADVVHTGVELVGRAAAEDMTVAAHHPGLFEHQHPVPRHRQVPGTGQTAHAAADHDGVPVARGPVLVVHRCLFACRVGRGVTQPHPPA